jgi:N-acetylglucosamine kinase-like BadF-type ATPase
MLSKSAVAFVLGMGLFVGAAQAQTVNANNLVNVNVSNVANDIAKNLKVNVSQIPATVQVPVGVAATVCDVQASVLGQGTSGPAQCTAKSTSAALNQAVQKQIGKS